MSNVSLRIPTRAKRFLCVGALLVLIITASAPLQTNTQLTDADGKKPIDLASAAEIRSRLENAAAKK